MVEVKAVPAPPEKPMTSDLTAKLLSLTAEASNKTSQVPPVLPSSSSVPTTPVPVAPVAPCRVSVKSEPLEIRSETKPSSLTMAKNIFFSGLKSSEKEDKKPPTTPTTTAQQKTFQKSGSELLFGSKSSQPAKKLDLKTPVVEKEKKPSAIVDKKPELKKRDSDTPSVELPVKSVAKTAESKTGSSKFALFGQDPNVKVVKKKSVCSLSPEKPIKTEKVRNIGPVC